MSSKKIRILAIGMVDSPHFIRWLEQFRTEELDIHIFPSSPNRRVHSRLVGLRKESGIEIKYDYSPLLLRFSFLVSIIDLVLRGRVRRYFLVRRIRNFAPDIVHALEIQHAGYLLLGVLERCQKSSLTVVTNYGSDLFWYVRFPGHEKKIRALLERTDVYGAECERDLALARKYGFNGTFLDVLPNAGGLPMDNTIKLFERQRTSERSLILIKGYTNFVGRAQDILLRLSGIYDEISDARIVVYSSTFHARLIVWWLRRIHKIESIVAFPKRALSHEQMLDLFAQARLYVGFSQSDGISTSMVEALTVGCIPLQTITACIDEWHVKGARIIPLDSTDPDGAVKLIASTWNLGSELDNYARVNRRVAEEHLDSEFIQRQIRAVYRSLLN